MLMHLHQHVNERGLAKGMTCRSQMALAVRDLSSSPGRSMATIQSAIVGYFESHTITKFRTNGQRIGTSSQIRKITQYSSLVTLVAFLVAFRSVREMHPLGPFHVL